MGFYHHLEYLPDHKRNFFSPSFRFTFFLNLLICCTYYRIVCICNRRGCRSFHPIIICCSCQKLRTTSTDRNYLAKHRYIRLRTTGHWMHLHKINKTFKFGCFHIPQIRRRRSKFRIQLKRPPPIAYQKVRRPP